MSIGANIAVIAVGAILTFATHVHTSGFSVAAVGAVLMAVGVVSLGMQLASLARQRNLTADEAVMGQLGQPVVVRPDPRFRARRPADPRANGGYRR